MNYGTNLRGLLFVVLVFGSPGLTQAQYDVNAPEPLPPLEGTLFLHGGGTVDSAMRQRFTMLSGGNEARIVVIPTADTSDPLNTKKLEVWQEHQPKSVEFLHAEFRDLLANSRLEALLENASKKESAYADFLLDVVSAEADARRQRYLKTRLRLAHLPYVKTFDQFDFAFQPSIDERQIREFRTLRFVHEASHVILLGPPGVGKTHLAVALAEAAIQSGQAAYFIS